MKNYAVVVKRPKPTSGRTTMKFKLVVIESPYAGDIERNMLYLKRAAQDCLSRGEAPYASHEMYTRWLDDSVPAHRTQGIEAGLAWGSMSEAVVAYTDYGVSAGMQLGIDRAQEIGKPIEFRTIGPNQ